MTTAQLKDRLVRVERVAYGLYKYTFRYKGKIRCVYDNDSTKYDAITTGEKTAGTTQRQALINLYSRI